MVNIGLITIARCTLLKIISKHLKVKTFKQLLGWCLENDNWVSNKNNFCSRNIQIKIFNYNINDLELITIIQILIVLEFINKLKYSKYVKYILCSQEILILLGN